MLTLAPAIAELAVGVPRSFLASGGLEPYVYSLITGAGSIDSDGVYTAPNVVPAPDAAPVIVCVTDANGNKAESEVLVCRPVELLGLIIQRELGLRDGSVRLWDQKLNAPGDKGLFVVLSELTPKCYANMNEFNPATNAQEQSSNWVCAIDVDIISRGNEAMTRKEEVVMALKSQYSLQQQELNGFSIAQIPTAIRNLSQIDGAAIPYRFNFSVNLLYNVKKIQPAEYFDVFETPELVVDP